MASGRQQLRDARKLVQRDLRGRIAKTNERVVFEAASEPQAPALKAPPPEGLMQKVRKKAKKVLKKKGK